MSAGWIRWILLSSFVLFPGVASAQLFGGDDKKWEQLFFDIKKINSHLVDLEKGRLVAMEALQKDAVRQIEELKNIFPGFQGGLNDNRTGIENNTQILNDTLSRMAALETQLNNKIDNLNASVTSRFENQISSNVDFRKELVDKLGQLKEGLAFDFENLNKSSSQNFQSFLQNNQEVLGKIIASLNAQSQKVDEGQARMDNLVRNDLIPALNQEGNNNRAALLGDLEKLRVGIEEALKTHQSGLNTNRDQIQTNVKQVADLSVGMQTWNDKLVGILKQNLQINTQTREQVDGVKKGLDETGKTIGSVNGQFKQVADAINTLNNQGQVTGNALLVIQTGIANLENAEKSADKKVDQLLLSSGEMIKHDLALETAVAENRAQMALSNDKLTKLIEILKSIAQEQNALQKVVEANNSGTLLKEVAGQVKNFADSNLDTSNKILQSQNQLVASQNSLLQANQQGMEQILQEQNALNETSKLVLQSQNELVTSQNELLKSSQGGSSGGASPAQVKEIIDRLVDLRNKGNLNISINQDIQKTLKTIASGSSKP